MVRRQRVDESVQRIKEQMEREKRGEEEKKKLDNDPEFRAQKKEMLR